MVNQILFFGFIVAIMCLAQTTRATELVIDGSTGVKPLIESLAKHYAVINKGAKVEIGKGLKPKPRIDALIKNKIDIAMASHGIDENQIKTAGLQIHKIAKVAVVMGVNHRISIDNLSNKQLCEIYRGNIVDWHDIHGGKVKLIPFIRPLEEVDVEVIVRHVPCFSNLPLAETVQIMNKSGQMAKALSTTKGAIGMTTLVRVAQSNGKIKAIAFNTVKPTSENLINGTYPLSRDIYLITKLKPKAEVVAFLDFIQSKQGANIIEQNNAAPQ